MGGSSGIPGESPCTGRRSPEFGEDAGSGTPEEKEASNCHSPSTGVSTGSRIPPAEGQIAETQAMIHVALASGERPKDEETRQTSNGGEDEESIPNGAGCIVDEDPFADKGARLQDAADGVPDGPGVGREDQAIALNRAECTEIIQF